MTRFMKQSLGYCMLLVGLMVCSGPVFAAKAARPLPMTPPQAEAMKKAMQAQIDKLTKDLADTKAALDEAKTAKTSSATTTTTATTSDDQKRLAELDAFLKTHDTTLARLGTWLTEREARFKEWGEHKGEHRGDEKGERRGPPGRRGGERRGEGGPHRGMGGPGGRHGDFMGYKISSDAKKSEAKAETKASEKKEEATASTTATVEDRGRGGRRGGPGGRHGEGGPHHGRGGPGGQRRQ